MCWVCGMNHRLGRGQQGDVKIETDRPGWRDPNCARCQVEGRRARPRPRNAAACVAIAAASMDDLGRVRHRPLRCLQPSKKHSGRIGATTSPRLVTQRIVAAAPVKIAATRRAAGRGRRARTTQMAPGAPRGLTIAFHPCAMSAPVQDRPGPRRLGAGIASASASVA